MGLNKPNVLLIVCDDMGYSDLGCFGSEIDTPHLDALAGGGCIYDQFYVSPRCAPSRAALLTGLNPHQAGVGILTYQDGPLGYPGHLNERCATMAQVLQANGYGTYIAGKWHLSSDTKNENKNWPLHRGFDHYFGTLAGSCSYYNPHTLMRDNDNIENEIDDDFYYTDAIADHAVNFIDNHFKQNTAKPFFEYVAFTAPHWPLQAPESVVRKYKGRFAKGWDKLREERLQRLIDKGLANPEWDLPKDARHIPDWESVDNKAWYERCMEVYAAQVEVMDRGVGRILNKLNELGQRENTLIFFLSDNGSCAEVIKPHPTPGATIVPKPYNRKGEPIMVGNHPELMPGGEDTYQTYSCWAYLSSTPFHYYKTWTHEGGIASPLIVNGPGFGKGELRRSPGNLTDIAATVYDATGVSYPDSWEGEALLPLEGVSLLNSKYEALAQTRPMCWEHQGNGGIRVGKWKAVREYPKAWELYNLEDDRGETRNLAMEQTEIATDLIQQYYAWARRCGVVPREQILGIPGRKTIHNDYCGWMI